MSHVRAQESFSPFWYGVLIVASTALFILAMGGGLFGLGSDHLYHRLSHMAFDSLCHQQPERSLTISGLTMSVCSRCFGIYGSFWIGLLTIPLLIHVGLPYGRKRATFAIMLALTAITIDFLGNLAGIWMNSHQSRIILGVLFGLSLAWLLAGEYKQKPNIYSHGTS